MKSVAQLRAWRDNLKSSLAKVQPIRDQFLARKAAIEADNTRYPDFIRDRVNEARDAAYPLVGKHLVEARNLANVVAAEAAAWRSIPYVLSRAKFNKDDAIGESMTRAQWHRELSQAPGGLYALMVEDAKRDGNHAALYQAYLVGLARHGEKGFHQVDIGKLEIPEQAEALALIAECTVVPAQIEHVVGQISGRHNPNPMVAAAALIPRPLMPTVGFDAPSELPRPQDPAAAEMDATLTPLQKLQQHRDRQAEAA